MKLRRLAALTAFALAACRGEWHFADDAGAASGCPDAGCPFSLSCSPTLQRCVECIADVQCTTDRPHCDTRRGACVECLDSSDCDAGSVCETSKTRRCVPRCTSDAGCALGPCRTVDVGMVCDACVDESWCRQTSGTRHCDEERRVCVACKESEDCPPSMRCDRRSGTCQECIDSRDCAPGSFCVTGACRAAP